jgi:hypothetical protein
MIAYKFLCAGGLGPFSRYAWPLPRDGRPGPWVVAAGDATLCATAVHGCRVVDLPWWLQDELWEAEFDGPITRGRHKIAARRARLVRRVGAWDAGMASGFAAACAWRARDHAVTAAERAGAAEAATALRAAAELRELRSLSESLTVPEAARISVTMAGAGAIRALQGPHSAATAAYIAAHAAGQLDGPAALDAERDRQAAWLQDRLGLHDAPLAV